VTLSKGKLPLRWEADAFSSDHPRATAVHDALEAFAAKNSIWVEHTAGNEMFAGVNARLDKMASAAGYQKIELRQVRDGNNAPVFEIFRIEPSLGPLPSSAALGTALTEPFNTLNTKGRTLRPGPR
jgi:hypothetical protein